MLDALVPKEENCQGDMCLDMVEMATATTHSQYMKGRCSIEEVMDFTTAMYLPQILGTAHVKCAPLCTCA